MIATQLFDGRLRPPANAMQDQLITSQRTSITREESGKLEAQHELKSVKELAHDLQLNLCQSLT